MWWVIHICVCIAFCICFQLHQWRIQRGFDWNPSLSPVFKYRMKMKLFGLSETKLFYFHGIFKKNKIKSKKQTPYEPLFRNPGSAPELHVFCVQYCPMVCKFTKKHSYFGKYICRSSIYVSFLFYRKYLKC